MIVVDLDGTLITRNSFRIFVKFLFKESLRRFRPASLIELLWFNACRKAGVISHKRLKWKVMKVADSVMDSGGFSRLAEQILTYTNHDVVSFLENKDWILATAASEEYVSHLTKRLGCRAYVATVRPQSGLLRDYVETRGDEKLRLVREVLGNEEIETVLTDHYDDYPLLCAAKHRILVNPSSKTLNHPEIKALNPEVWSQVKKR